MSSVFDKLNLMDEPEILVLGAPEGFEPEIAALRGVTVHRRLEDMKRVPFALAFVTRRAEIDRLWPLLLKKAHGDAVLWFAYPKGTSKKFTCDFNRDTGWDALRESHFDSVRMIAIDADWSALRFRRTEFIKRARR